MTTLDQVSLAFVGVCTIGIAYLALIEPLREWLEGQRHKRNKPRH